MRSRSSPGGRHAATHGVVYLFAVVLALSFATRLVIAARLETTGWSKDPLGVMQALGAGLLADGGVALVAAALILALLLLCSFRGLRLLGHGLVMLLIVGLVFAAVAEVFFWEEFASRLNGIAVFYLMFPREVIGNLRESFALSLYLPLIAAVGLAIWWNLRRSLHETLQRRRPGALLKGLAAAAALGGAGACLLVLAPTGLSANRELNELALNGLSNMVSAALTNDSRYDGVYPGIEESRALPLLRAMVQQDNTRFIEPDGKRSILRWVDNGTAPRRLNVVLVIEESYGSRFVDVLDGETATPTSPNLDRLSRQGLFFTNVYASGQRSVRGLEALLTSFTPIPGISTARRPGSEGMHSLPEVLERFGYRTAMLYGGRASFDNMGPFWRGIGFDQVWDQSDIKHQSFTTIWGVCDEDLFSEALDRMDHSTADGRPVFLSMFTVSNHRPYEFPQDHVQWDPSMGNRENTARYADWAFADFLERAKRHRWFDDTVFVFVADHGHKVNGAAAVPLYRYRIPMLFYSPKHIPAQQVDTLAAQIDFVPTLLGQLGLSYESPFFGMDILRVPPGGGRIAVAHNFSVAFAVPGHAVVLEPTGAVKGYRFEPGARDLQAEPPEPGVDETARALTQTAHRMFYARQYHQARGGDARAQHARLAAPGGRDTN